MLQIMISLTEVYYCLITSNTTHPANVHTEITKTRIAGTVYLALARLPASPSLGPPAAGEFADGSFEFPPPSAPGCPHHDY